MKNNNIIPKKILFIVPSLRVGGLERAQVNLANELVKCGHDVTIKLIEDFMDLVMFLDPRIKVEHISHRRFPFWQNAKFFWSYYDIGRWETRATPKQLYKYYVMREKYDVEIAFFKGTPLKIISGSTNNDSKKLLWVHSDPEFAGGLSSNFKNFKQALKAYRKFDKIVCVSKLVQKRFIEKTGIKDNVTTIYNVCPVEEIIEKAKETLHANDRHKFKIIAVGRILNNVKGFDRLLQVCKKLNEDKFSYSLTIVGDGPDRDELQRYIDDNDLTNVKLTGMQKNPYKYIKNSDLLVCSSYFEGYNFTVAESLILGTPVLSTNCAGPYEILNNGEFGMIVENTSEGLYQGIKKMISDKDVYNYYKSKTKDRLSFFDTEKIIKEVENLFQ